MADPRQGEVYVWPAVPQNHPMGMKDRMWVVVSRDVFNRHANTKHVLACPLTSYPATELDIEVRVTSHNPLKHTSTLLPRMITPILKAELKKPVGRLLAKDLHEVLDRLRLIIEAP